MIFAVKSANSYFQLVHVFFRVERTGAPLPETRDQPFTPISSATIELILLKMCIYVVLLSKTALF